MSEREPNAIQITPRGIEIAYYDSVGVDGEPQQRRYLVNGDRFINVTTILNVLSKEALLGWVADLTRQGKDWREVRDDAGSRGSNTHHLLLQLLTDKRASLADLEPDERAWGQAAYSWLRDRQPNVLLAETMVAAPTYGYAGRLDLLAEIDGIATLADFKTVTKWAYERSKKRAGQKLPPYDENLLQLDLYLGACEESGYPVADRGLIVRLGPDGDYDETFVPLDPERGRAILTAYRSRGDARKTLREARDEVLEAA